MLPSGWQPCRSSAVEAYRFLAQRSVLQLLFIEGRVVYDYPCTPELYAGFIRASSKGRYVNTVLRPYAQRRGWSGVARPFTGRS